MLRTYSYRKIIIPIVIELTLLYTKSSSVVAIKPTGLSATCLLFQKRGSDLCLSNGLQFFNFKELASLPHFFKSPL